MTAKNSFVLIYGGFERAGCLNNKKKRVLHAREIKVEFKWSWVASVNNKAIWKQFNFIAWIMSATTGIMTLQSFVNFTVLISLSNLQFHWTWIVKKTHSTEQCLQTLRARLETRWTSRIWQRAYDNSLIYGLQLQYAIL